MASSQVPAEINVSPAGYTDHTLLVQGFRDGEGKKSYVFIGNSDSAGESAFEISLTPENAHILSEEIRRHAEFAQTVREQGE